VFPGTGERPWEPEDQPNPLNVYGLSKYLGEEAVRKYVAEHFIVRISWLFGLNGKNFVKTMLKVGEERDEVSVVSDQHGSPTYTEDLTNFIFEAITKKIPYGIYNATDDGYTTWADFTKKIFELAGLKTKVNPISTEEYMKNANKTVAKRPLNSKMSKEKLKNAGIFVPRWEDSLEKYLKKEGEY
jgi:dTDP-4-dehydrorhamnose reductase